MVTEFHCGEHFDVQSTTALCQAFPSSMPLQRSGWPKRSSVTFGRQMPQGLPGASHVDVEAELRRVAAEDWEQSRPLFS
jgi:hypothetical protein